MSIDRRHFLAHSAAALSAGSILSSCSEEEPVEEKPVEAGPSYEISLAQWSKHRALKGGDLDNLDFPAYTAENFGIHAIEWVNQFFFVEHDTLGIQPKGANYIAEMKQRCDDAGVQTLLIMCDRVGSLGDPDSSKRKASIEGHFAWLDATKELGGHSIRVNARSDASLSPERQADLCADGLRRLSDQAATLDLNVIVENHGGLSSNGAWLANVMRMVDRDNCGTLPDYGNFYVVKKRGDLEKFQEQIQPYVGDPSYTEDEVGLGYDRYKGTEELMPFAKGVSAKAFDFDEEGNEVSTDFARMMEIIVASGYEGHLGVEYEGKTIEEDKGIKMTKALLERVIAGV